MDADSKNGGRLAEALNHQFQSIFTKEDLVNMPSKGESPYKY